MIWYTCDVRHFSAEEYAAALEHLDATKRARVERMRQRKDRLRTVAADKLARDILAREMKIAPEEVEFVYTEKGKPLVANGSLCFNISHCEDIVVCAVSKTPIGIDIEQIRDISPRLAKKYCSKEELVYLFNKDPGDIDWSVPFDTVGRLHFFELWTAKEAYLKCTGEGISHMRALNTLPLKFVRHILPENYLLTIYQEQYSTF